MTRGEMSEFDFLGKPAHGSGTRGLLPWRHLLQRPGVAVRVAEGDKRAPRICLHVAGWHAARDELLPGGLDIGDDDLHALLRARRPTN